MNLFNKNTISQFTSTNYKKINKTISNKTKNTEIKNYYKKHFKNAKKIYNVFLKSAKNVTTDS